MILLVTNQRDLTMDYVVRELTGQCVPFIRLNTEDLPKAKVRFGIQSPDDWEININDHKFTGASIKAAYFRRPEVPQVTHGILTDSENEYIQNEWLSILKNLYWRLEGKWLNCPTHIFLAEDKPKQLVLANKLGFNIPETNITNRYDLVSKMQEQIQVVAKPLKHALMSHDEVIFTSRIQAVTPSQSDSIQLAPVIFQEEVEKLYDIRVTVVGSSIFSVCIKTLCKSTEAVDWRSAEYTNLVHEVIDLPNELQEKCQSLMKILGLNFGAIDFVYDKNEKYWFLEINPNGQWAWIENQTKLPIAKTIVEELLTISKREHI
jgi:glutathione synthase/RimK-type ligase-like ATP-grasp enzyme